MKQPSLKIKRIPGIVEEHREEAVFLWLLRDRATRAPHYRLTDLARLDDRISAHLNGLLGAGSSGIGCCAETLGVGKSEDVFVAAVVAFESANDVLLEAVLDRVSGAPETRRGLISAAGWIEPAVFHRLRASAHQFPVSFQRDIALAASLHRMHTGAEFAQLLSSECPLSCARALRAAGELQRTDLLDAVHAKVADKDPKVRFWASWAAALLGSTDARLNLREFFADPVLGHSARQVYLRSCDPAEAKTVIAEFAANDDTARFAVTGLGMVGDPDGIPTLVRHMASESLARVAGEAFSMITGVDFAYDKLDRVAPQATTGPNDDPDDEDVEMDIDEDVLWPDAALVGAWWDDHQREFESGNRYLCGHPITVDHCRRVLQQGYQRQRIAAALELTLMQSGTPLFECRAPAYRQKQWLEPE